MLRKSQQDYCINYTLDQLIDQVRKDLIILHKFDETQYEDWFTLVYPMGELINTDDNNPYCKFILTYGEPLAKRLEQWLNYVTTEY